MLLLASSVCGLFKWRQFEPEVILMAVGWYLHFSLSYRDVEELLAERGLLVDHVTVWRWVQRYAPEIQCRLRLRLRPTNDSWRVDETYIRVKGKWVYLYRGAFSAKPWAEKPSGTARNQHRRARRLSTSHRAAQIRGYSGGIASIDRFSTSIMFWNRITGQSQDCFSAATGSLLFLATSPQEDVKTAV
jgi:hypothetical protein